MDVRVAGETVIDRLRAALGFALAAMAFAAGAQDSKVDPAEAGRRIYAFRCQRCHGINLATSGIGFDLRTFPRNDKERFLRSVTNGLRAMPAWGGILKREQMDLIWVYIGSVNGWTPEPAPAPR